MTDHNILNRASFDDMQKTFTITVPPFIREGGGTLELGGMNNVFWIKKVSWEYKYVDVGVPGARRTPILPIEVSVADILQNSKRALPSFIEPRPIVGKIPFKVINSNLSNNHRLEVEFYLDGVLVTPRPGVNLTLKEMKAYIMMDSSARGELALAEAAADKTDEALSQLGMGSIRDIIPGGMAGFIALPLSIQNALLHGLAAKGNISPLLSLQLGNNNGPPLALTNNDSQKEQSSFIGDIIASWPSEESKEFPTKEQLQKIANSMIEKGWRRI